ncbi:unnamed protein product [Phytomonas sp. EM1]|nr:unnamed protein product [Phytomonas sp. EM1]|eukprot:CCW63572.1 unnamed protein product [Phytomonas sp. isolate EM1]
MVERTTAEAERIAYRTHAAETVQEFIRARESSCLTEQRRRRKYLETVQLQAIVREELRREAAATSLQRAIRRHWRRQAEQKAQQEAARARAWVLRVVVQLQSWWRVCLAKRESACRRAQVAWLTRKRLELEDVRVLMEEELMEKGAQHLFYYHESGRTRDSPIAPHQNGVKEETEEINAMLDDSWAKIYEDEEIQS